MHCIHVFARPAPICNAQSAIIHKISASELRRKSIKGPLSVGKIVGWDGDLVKYILNVLLHVRYARHAQGYVIQQQLSHPLS